MNIPFRSITDARVMALCVVRAEVGMNFQVTTTSIASAMIFDIRSTMRPVDKTLAFLIFIRKLPDERLGYD